MTLIIEIKITYCIIFSTIIIIIIIKNSNNNIIFKKKFSSVLSQSHIVRDWALSWNLWVSYLSYVINYEAFADEAKNVNDLRNFFSSMLKIQKLNIY